MGGGDPRAAPELHTFLSLVEDRGARVVPTDLIFISVGLAAALMNALLGHDSRAGYRRRRSGLRWAGGRKVEAGFPKRILCLDNVVVRADLVSVQVDRGSKYRTRQACL